MCFIVLFISLFIMLTEFRLFGRLSGLYGGGALIAEVLLSGWFGVKVLEASKRRSAQLTQLLQSGQLDSKDQMGLQLLIPIVYTFCGLMLILPGVLTDGLALFMLIPWVTRVVARSLVSRVPRGGTTPFGGKWGTGGVSFGGGPFGSGSTEGEYRDTPDYGAQDDRSPSDHIVINVTGREIEDDEGQEGQEEDRG
jgi:UPF0716 protein FxsA